MHEGRMIFSGPMRDMKQRLRRDDFTLELDGNPQAIEDVARRASELPGLSARIRGQHAMVVQVNDDRSRAAALVDVLQLIDGGKVLLHSVRSGQNETEDAYLQLLQEDNAHGFRRFDFQDRRPVDADAGDL
jgi:hypothetical protein